MTQITAASMRLRLENAVFRVSVISATAKSLSSATTAASRRAATIWSAPDWMRCEKSAAIEPTPRSYRCTPQVPTEVVKRMLRDGVVHRDLGPDHFDRID